MTENEALIFLKNIKGVTAKIEAKSYEIKRVLTSREFVETLRYEEMLERYRGNEEMVKKTLEKLEKTSFCFSNILDSLTSDLEKTVKEREDAEKVFSSLPEVCEKLLRLRYIEGRPWFYVADKLIYSDRQTYYLHKKAVKKFAENWTQIIEKK